jgi:short-subunit dehydrogenase
MHIIITGGGSGLGFALMQKHLTLGHKVTVIDLLPIPDELVGHLNLEWIQSDVRDLVDFVALLKSLVAENVRFCRVYLVAGIGYFGNLMEQTVESINQLISVNLSVRIKQTREIICISEKNDIRFQIFLVSSSTAMIPLPFFSVYSATTAGLLSFSRACRSELKGRHVKVAVVLPDGMETNFQRAAGVRSSSSRLLNPEFVARKLVTKSTNYSGVMLIGHKINLVTFAQRTLPVKFFDILTSFASKTKFH